MRPRRRHSGRLTPAWTAAWARDSFVILAAQPFSVLATSLVAILIARELDPGDWATFSAFLGLALGLSIVVDSGLGTWLLRELSGSAAATAATPRMAEGKLIGASLTFNALGALVTGLATVTIAVLAGADGTEVLTLVLLVIHIGTFASASICDATLRSRRRVGWVAAGTLVEKGSLLVLVGCTILLGEASIPLFAAAYALSSTSRLVLLGGAALRGIALARAKLWELPALVRAALPFALSALSLNLVPRLDTLVLLGMSSTSAAYIALGERTLGPALIVPVVLSLSLYPFIAGRGTRVSWPVVGGVTALGAVIAAVGIALSPTLVPAIFGETYRPAITTVQLFMLILPFSYASNVLLTYLYTASTRTSGVRDDARDRDRGNRARGRRPAPRRLRTGRRRRRRAAGALRLGPRCHGGCLVESSHARRPRRRGSP